MKWKLQHYVILAEPILLLGVIVGYSLIKYNIVPVARVNGDVILLSEVKDNAAVSAKLYEQAPELVGVQDTELAALFESENTEALFARSLESSIVSAILRSSVPKETLREADRLATRSVAEANIRALGAALKNQYGWDVEVFKERVVEPQVLRQLLAKTHGDSYEEWLRAARENANVNLWFIPFDWSGGELIEK